MNFDQPFLKRNFIGQSYIVQDTSENSPYIEIVDMPRYIGGGVNVIKFYPSQVNLHSLSPIEVEVLDAIGNPVRTEIPTYRDRFGNYYVSIYVFDSTAEGQGSISFVGTANATPQGEYLEYDQVNSQGHNLIITKPLTILPFERNNSPLVFDVPPIVDIAQVITPARIIANEQVTLIGSNTSYAISMSSANNVGFDKTTATSKQIQDVKIQAYKYDNKGKSSTTNIVDTVIRKQDADIMGGFLASDVDRFNTILTLDSVATTFRFSSSYKGASVRTLTLGTYNDGTINAYSFNLTRAIPNAVFDTTNPYDEDGGEIPGVTQSLKAQLDRYNGSIVRVINDTQCIVDKPFQANILSYNTNKKNSITRKIKHTFRASTKLGLNFKYQLPQNPAATSSLVSQSYLQFTFQGLSPIGGSVYRIKSFYKQSSITGDYKLINDQQVGLTEYLTDATYPNQTTYAKELTPFLLYGHFTSANIIQTYWKAWKELVGGFDTYTASWDNSTLLESTKLAGVYIAGGEVINNPTTVFTTNNYQIYQKDQTFSLAFNCILDPYTELEVYANSKPLTIQLYGQQGFTPAFTDTKNTEKQRYAGSTNRFGKFIGKITNNSNAARDYAKVVFDFKADDNGLGRPLFRVKTLKKNTFANVYLSEVGVSPRLFNGLTPQIVQYAVPAPEGFESLLSESVDYKFEYYDYTGNQSEFVTYVNGLALAYVTEPPTNACAAEHRRFTFNHDYITAISSSLLTGSALISTTKFYDTTTTDAQLQQNIPLTIYNYDQWRYFTDWDTIKYLPKNLAVAYGGTYLDNNYTRTYADYQYTGITNPSPQQARISTWNCLQPIKKVVHPLRVPTGSSAGAGVDTLSSAYDGRFDYTNVWGLNFYNQGGTNRVTGSIVTASWKVFSDFTENYNQTNALSGQSPFMSIVYSASHPFKPVAFFPGAPVVSSGSLIDGQPVFRANSVGITRFDISQSYTTTSNYPTFTAAQVTRAYKQRRLFYPAQGFATASYFQENGGVYNVKFRLKRYESGSNSQNWYSPDTGSYLMAYIFDVNSNWTVTDTTGSAGFYPPSQNIVKIGNNITTNGYAIPAISFYDSNTGYRYDEYEINLIQYGSPAQLVFEPSGDSGNYFGCALDYVEFCKIGVTTDPYYIQPPTQDL